MYSYVRLDCCTTFAFRPNCQHLEEMTARRSDGLILITISGSRWDTPPGIHRRRPPQVFAMLSMCSSSVQHYNAIPAVVPLGMHRCIPLLSVMCSSCHVPSSGICMDVQPMTDRGPTDLDISIRRSRFRHVDLGIRSRELGCQYLHPCLPSHGPGVIHV